MAPLASSAGLGGRVDIGGPALEAGTYPGAVSYATTLAPVEGIIEIDSTLLPPANRLRMNVSDTMEIVPSYGTACYAVTIARNIPPDSVHCPVAQVGPVVFLRTEYNLFYFVTGNNTIVFYEALFYIRFVDFESLFFKFNL